MAGENRSASQRISDLERVAAGLYNTADNFARDIGLLKDLVKRLGNTIEAMSRVIALHAPGLTDFQELTQKEMLNINVEELKARLASLISQGILKPGEAIDENSFVVSEEVDKDGTVVNPRLQFAPSALGNKDHVAKLTGAKAGDVITLDEDKLRIKILEVYEIVPPTLETEAEQESQASPETPAQETSPSGNA